MFSESVIHPRTIQAYLETDYRVHAEPMTFTLRVGVVSEELQALHRQLQTNRSAFLTACNPYSAMLEPVVNRERQANLVKELARRCLTPLPAVGQHPSNGWPDEDSFLVPGLDLESAKLIGIRFQQNGFIWVGEDAVPQLILLR